MNGTPTANDLRKAAEFADGHRGVDVYLVNRPSKIAGDDQVGVIAVLQKDANDTLLCTMRTPFTEPNSNMNLTPIDYVEARSGGISWSNLADRPTGPNDTAKWNLDALFWSEAAIEKFLVPYYASVFAKVEMDSLYQAYTDKNVYALGHRVPTVYTALTPGNGGSGGGGGGGGSGALGPPPSDAFHSLSVLTADPSIQAPEALSLSDYARRRANE